MSEGTSKEDQERAEQSQGALAVASIIAILAFISFAAIDPLLISGSLAPAYTVRAVFIAALSGLFLLNRQPGMCRDRAEVLAHLAFACTAVPVLLLTLLTGGGASRYHEALILTILAYALLPFAWTVRSGTAAFVTSFVAYILMTVTTGRTGTAAEFATAIGILATTVVIGHFAMAASERQRQQDWRQRRELASANEQLQAADRSKTRFFANLSHELRTPLTLALAPVQSLLANDGGLGEEARERLRLVERNALRLLRLVDDLLELTRAEGASLRLRPESVDLVELVDQLLALAQPLAEHKGLRLARGVGPEQVRIDVDRQQIERVLLNLVSNSAKFTETGGIEVSVVDEGEHVQIIVRDTGSGIPAAELERIFDRFHQVDDSQTKRHGGTGIGLSLVRELVHLHGGTVHAESEPGRGTSMFVRLPRQSAPAAPIERRRERKAAESERRQAPTGLPEWHEALRKTSSYRFSDLEVATGTHWKPVRPRLSQRTVLVIEDNADMRGFIGSLLSARFEVLMSPDGMDGYRTAVERRPDLIVSDVMMPGITGFEVVERLRAHNATSDIPVVLLTARGEVDDRVEGRARGADAYLCKPFNPDELIAAVEGLLKRRAATEDLVRRERDEALQSLATGFAHGVDDALVRLASEIDRASEEVRVAAREPLERLRLSVDELRTYALAGTGGAAAATDVDAVLRRTCAYLPPEIEPRVQRSCRARQRLFLASSDLERVLLHLIDNAVRACRAGGVVLVVAEDEDDEVLIRVTDEGQGVPADAAERIFAPYYSTREDGASGLGLSLSRQIVRAMGGSLELDRSRTVGASFVLRLPAHQPDRPSQN